MTQNYDQKPSWDGAFVCVCMYMLCAFMRRPTSPVYMCLHKGALCIHKHTNPHTLASSDGLARDLNI